MYICSNIYIHITLHLTSIYLKQRICYFLISMEHVNNVIKYLTKKQNLVKLKTYLLSQFT